MLQRRAVQNKRLYEYIVQEMKFSHLDTYLISLCLLYQSDFLSISVSISVCLPICMKLEATIVQRLLMLQFLCPVCRKLVGPGPGATPFHVTIRVVHKHTCRRVYKTVPQVALKGIQCSGDIRLLQYGHCGQPIEIRTNEVNWR
jgi:hypothetical protein